MRRVLLAILFLLPASALAAPDDTCTSQSSFNWPSITDTGTADWSCTGGDTNPGADDDFVIDTAHTVTPTGDITWGSTAGVNLAVNGTLALDPTNNSNNSLEITLSDDGMTVGAAGTITVQDRWIVPAATVTYATTPADSWMTVSEVIPCPVNEADSTPAVSGDSGLTYESDCANGNANQVMLKFDDVAAGEVGDQFIGEVLAAVTAGEEAWCWGESDPTKPVVDTTSCYEIDVVNTNDDFIVIDVRQGNANADGYPFAQRDIAEYCLAAKLDGISRTVEVDDCSGGSAFTTIEDNSGVGGLEDLTADGSFNGFQMGQYTVTISATGTPDQFDWTFDQNNDGDTADPNDNSATGVAITGSAQALDDGLSITFGATTGHTLNDSWTIKAIPYFHNARFIAFAHADSDDTQGDGDGVATIMDENEQMRLELTVDEDHYLASNSNDTLYLADWRGAKRTYADNTRVWITYGQMGGETGAFRVPVRILSATAVGTDHGDTPIDFTAGATVDFDGGILDGLRMTPVLPDGANFLWTWAKDPAGDSATGCTTGGVFDLDAANSENVRFERYFQSGGVAGTEANDCHRLHTFTTDGSLASDGFQLKDSRVRHGGDDLFASATSGSWKFTRVVAEFASAHSQSMEMIQGSTAGSGSAIDLYCGDCLGKRVAGSGVIDLSNNDDAGAVQNLIAIGIQGHLGGVSSNRSALNWSLYGGTLDLTTGEGFMGGDVTNFVVDHFFATGNSSGSEVLKTGSTMRSGIIRRSEGREDFAIDLLDNAFLSNVLIYDTKGGGANETSDPCSSGGGDTACNIFRGNNTDGATLEYATILGTTGVCSAMSINAGDPDNQVSGVLIAHFTESVCRMVLSAELAVVEQVVGSDPWCFFDGANTGSGPHVADGAEDDLPAGSTRGVNPLWVDAARGQYLPREGGTVAAAGCGAKKGAGVSQKTWAHYLSRLEPDCLGCTGLPGGGGGSAIFPGPVRP